MIKLLLDCSTTKIGVAIAKDNDVLDSVYYEAWQEQSEKMIPEIQAILSRNNLSKENLNAVVVSIGPGSYTGVRIGITIAKVMCLALNIPLFPVSSLAILKDNDKPSICLINARSGRSYFGVYQGNKVLVKDKILTNEEVKAYIQQHKDYSICGDVFYLGLKNNDTSIFKQMISLTNDESFAKDIFSVNPVYLKD